MAAEETTAIEVPAPTAWPLVLAMGVTLMFAGLLTNMSVTVLGVALSLAGCGGWFREVAGEWKPELWFGPSISWRPSTKLWFTAGGGGAMVGRARVPDATVRFTIALSI